MDASLKNEVERESMRNQGQPELRGKMKQKQAFVDNLLTLRRGSSWKAPSARGGEVVNPHL